MSLESVSGVETLATLGFASEVSGPFVNGTWVQSVVRQVPRVKQYLVTFTLTWKNIGRGTAVFLGCKSVSAVATGLIVYSKYEPTECSIGQNGRNSILFTVGALILPGERMTEEITSPGFTRKELDAFIADRSRQIVFGGQLSFEDSFDCLASKVHPITLGVSLDSGSGKLTGASGRNPPHGITL